MTARRLVAVSHTALLAGAEQVLLDLLARARDRGWSPLVVVPEGPMVAQLAAMGIERAAIPDLMLPAGPVPVAAARLGARTAAAARVLREHADDADVIVAAGLRVLPALRLARPRAPVAWLAQSVVGTPRWRSVLRASGDVVDIAIAVSGAVADSIGPRRFPVRVVWNGTPWPVEPACPEPPQPPVVGCAAVLTPWKGQNVLLEAVARLGDRGVVLELLGHEFPKDTAYADALRERAAEPDLAGRVRFLGRVEDCLPYMRRWSVAVVASVEPEAGPLSALEAMSVGVPLVASDHGGPQEIVGDAGLLVRPGDPVALADAIRALVDDPDARRRCGVAGRARIASHHTIDGQMALMLDAVESVAGARVG